MEENASMVNSNSFARVFASIHKGIGRELLQELLDINIQRERVLSIVLIMIDIILLYTDTIAYNELRPKQYSFYSAFYAHIALLIVPLVFLLLFHISKKGRFQGSIWFKKVLHLWICMSVLLFSMFSSLHALLSQGQIYSYTIAVFCIASMALFTLGERLFIFLTSYIIFAAGILIMRDNINELFWNLFFVTLLSAIAIIASSFNFSAYVKNYNNQKIIMDKTRELDNMYKSVEGALEKRTQELTEANERLIDEIKEKHEVEIEYIKTKHLCDEKEKILSQTMEYEKLRTAFFANISHELRTPLTVIFSAQQMINYIINDGNLQESQKDVKQYIHIIKQNCYRLIRLIANLIDITKIDAGYFQVNLNNHDIVKVVEDITLSVAKYIEDKNIELIFDTEVEEKVIACDPEKVERIILNLLSNAVKFTPEGGQILINIYEGDGKVIISVKDTGLGIPVEMRDKIFDRFVQVDKTTSRAREGSGIGLSLVKSLVEMHYGSISLISESGKGSEFIIELLDKTISPDETMVDNNELNVSSNIERINVEFSEIYF